MEKFIISANDSEKDIVENAVKYMKSNGIHFSSVVTDTEGNSPYAILGGGSSIGYRNYIIRNRKRIYLDQMVIFCASDKTDMLKIKNRLSKEDYGNSQKERPYCFAFKPGEIDNIISILLENDKNKKSYVI